MIKFRQKEFVAPLVGLAASAIPSIAVEAGLGMASNKAQKKANEEQTAIMQEQARQQAKANKDIQKTLDKIAENSKNANTVQAIGQTLQQRQYAFLGRTARIVKRDVGGFAKDIGKLAWKRRNTLIGGTIAGGAMAGSAYLADKAVQHDMKKNNIPLDKLSQVEEKKYSIIKSTGSILKKTGKVIKEAADDNKGMIIATSAFGALPILSGYASDKAKLKDQIKNTTTETSRNYSILGSISKGAKSLKKGWGVFKSHPGQSILGFISSNIGQGGGRKEVMKFGRELESLGNKSGSRISKNVGKFIYNHPKTSLVGSTAVGLGVMANTWDRGEKTVKGLAKKLDKNAYAYQESKNQDIE